jgi:hypothetical protein
VYLSLMARAESMARHIISEADRADQNGKTIKLPSLEMNRMFLADRGTRSTHRFSSCAMCGHGLVDEPNCNKESARQNKLIDVKWAADCNKIDEYIKTGCNPLLDKNGAMLKRSTRIHHTRMSFSCAIVGKTGRIYSLVGVSVF